MTDSPQFRPSNARRPATLSPGGRRGPAFGFALRLAICGGAIAAGLGHSGTAEARQSSAAVWQMTGFQQETQPPAGGSDGQVEVFGRVILNPSPALDPELRRKATIELLQTGRSDAFDYLARALRSGNEVIMAPVIDVLLHVPVPFESLLEPAIEGLGKAPAGLVDALGAHIGRYGERGLELLTPVVTDRENPDGVRRAAIAAIASFRLRPSVDLLMDVIDPANEEPPSLVEQAYSSLRRLTGLDFPSEFDPWQSWWAEARELDSDEWLKQVLRSLGDQITALESRLTEQHRANEEISRRLGETLRLLYRTLPQDQQFARLGEDLRDPLPMVREAAIDRISRLLRDLVRLPEPVQDALAERLHDDVPAIRRRAARLLDDINYDRLADHLLVRLEDETDPAVAGELFSILADRPTVQAAPIAARWLVHSTVQEPAGEALWRLANEGLLQEESLTTVREAVSNAYERRPTPVIVRLYAAIGDDGAVERLREYLTADDADMRLAAARGFRVRGKCDDLVALAADPVIYPEAIRGLASAGGSLDALRTIVRMTPVAGSGDAGKSVWVDAIIEVSGKLPVEQLLEADDLIKSNITGESAVSDEIRLRTLSRVEDVAGNGVPSAVRIPLVLRWADLLCDVSDADRAWAQLERLNANNAAGSFASDIAVVRFRAAILTNRYDTAAELNNDPGAWLAQLEVLEKAEARHDGSQGRVSRFAEQIDRLREEIKRRFADQLSEDELSALALGPDMQMGDDAGSHSVANGSTDHQP